MKKSLYIILASLILITFNLEAQTGSSFSTQGWWKPVEAKFSPVVNADNTITFKVMAPRAKKVSLIFDEWDANPQPMQKDKTGVWSITIGPVSPRLYQYNFLVDGLKTIDMVNPAVKAGTMVYGSIVEVCGENPRYDELQNVPQGDVHIVSYTSTSLRCPRKMHIYVPAAYFDQPEQKFPVLYLRHGGGDNEGSWINDGRANVILDNLIAQGEAAAMLMVMTNGFTDGSWAGGSSVEGMALLEKELINDVIPIIEKKYRIAEGKNNRAIAGLSMGGGQAFVIGLRNLNWFSAIGEFSAGILSDAGFDTNKYLPGIFDNPQKVNNELHLLWISCGTKDPRYQGHRNLVDNLRQKGIENVFHEQPFGHEWEFWRSQLHDFAKEVFIKESPGLSMVDKNATPETRALYANLLKIHKKGVMFGHHDYPSYGIGWRGDEGRSDVKDLVGDHPAVYSLDMNRINNEKIEHIRQVHKRGGVSMLVWHQNNPLTESPEAKYPVGTAWDNTKVVDQILQEGSPMNLKYKQRLDHVAEVFHSMKDDNGKLIPVIFRPLHEHTQAWNWWGSKAATEEEFVNFWRFIVTYLRDVKNVHNVIYAISPQMDEVYDDPEGRLLFRWPGNDYVDFLGMDCYHGLNVKAFISNVNALSRLADKLSKPVGVTETGLENNHTSDYWTKDVLPVVTGKNCSMVVTWRNEKPTHAYGPYPGDASADDFITFYKSPVTLFENDLPDMYSNPE